MKQSGIMSLVKKRPELKKFLKGPGQPSIDWFVKKTIALKVIEYSKTWNMSKRQAFIKLCNLKSHKFRNGQQHEVPGDRSPGLRQDHDH